MSTASRPARAHAHKQSFKPSTPETRAVKLRAKIHGVAKNLIDALMPLDSQMRYVDTLSVPRLQACVGAIARMKKELSSLTSR